MRRIAMVLFATAALVAPAAAHHSPAAFDTSSQVTFQGRIARVDWTSPHTYVYVENTTTGKAVVWMLETDSVPILTRSGWTKEALAVGTKVTVRANPDKDPRRMHALLVSMALPTGVVLTPRAGGGSNGAKATSIAGVWNGLRGFTERRVTGFKPTAKGAAAIQAYTVAANPTARCVAYATPFLTGMPHLNQVEVGKDTVVIRNEFFSVDRTVYIDGRGHPKDGPRTNQGHSIGHWDNGALVVDTTLFADHPLGNYTGNAGAERRELPSGPRKHTVERFQLSDDKTRLLISAVVEDPDYLAEPFTVNMEWDYTPQLPMLRFGCTPEEAQRYLFR